MLVMQLFGSGEIELALLAVNVVLSGCGASRLPAERLVPIGAGIERPSRLRATVYARGLPTVAGFVFDSRGRLWAAAAGLGDHCRDGVYLIAEPGGAPVRVISGLDDPLGFAWYRGAVRFLGWARDRVQRVHGDSIPALSHDPSRPGGSRREQRPRARPRRALRDGHHRQL
jgi:hypothetical protein